MSSHIHPDEVHLWQIALERPQTEQEQLLNVLSAEERDRMSRFRFPDDRRRYLVAHGVLRQALARYLGVDPVSLRFQSNPNGKPALEMTGLTFNLSHSGELALLAVAAERQVGVDIERIRGDVAALEIAGRFFAPEETACLASLPPGDLPTAFFTMWTRKEALLKARGLTLGEALQDPANSRAGWSVESVAVLPEYSAAVAAEGHGWTVRRDPF